MGQMFQEERGELIVAAVQVDARPGARGGVRRARLVRGDRSDAQITRMALANLARQGFDVSRHVQGTGLAEVLKFAKSDNPEERGTAAALMSERPAGKTTLATEGAERLHQTAMAAYDLADKETNPDRAARLRQRGETMEQARQTFERTNGLPVRPLRSELVPEASETKRFVAAASPGWQQGQQEWFKASAALRARQEAEAAQPVEPTGGIPTKEVSTVDEELKQARLEAIKNKLPPQVQSVFNKHLAIATSPVGPLSITNPRFVSVDAKNKAIDALEAMERQGLIPTGTVAMIPRATAEAATGSQTVAEKRAAAEAAAKTGQPTATQTPKPAEYPDAVWSEKYKMWTVRGPDGALMGIK